ncbi:MAG: hypothetical protein SF070_03400 [Gemmatimonadota bacterium]|nr:hypothetical protein [Gemmatimonadota bacterium]
MVSLADLWAPILLSAFLVFLASSVIHMALKYHNKEYRGFSNEDEVRAAIRKGTPAPGLYFVPYCADMKDMGTPAMQQKMTEGPIAYVTVAPSGVPAMGPQLVQWFLFSVVVSVVSAYLASRTLAAGTAYLSVFRIAGCAAFLAYGFAYIPTTIWFKRPWSATLKDLFDALVYGLLTGGTFGWLWPQA